MNKGPLALLLILSFVWTLGGAGDLFAAGPGASPPGNLSDIPPRQGPHVAIKPPRTLALRPRWPLLRSST